MCKRVDEGSAKRTNGWLEETKKSGRVLKKSALVRIYSFTGSLSTTENKRDMQQKTRGVNTYYKK